MENRGVDRNIHTPVFTRTGFWSCWMFTLYYSLHLYCLHEKRRRFHHVGITEARVGGVGGRGVGDPRSPGDSRHLALSGAGSGSARGRDSPRRPPARGAGSTLTGSLPGRRGEADSLYGFLRPCGACRSPSRIGFFSEALVFAPRVCWTEGGVAISTHVPRNHERRTKDERS